MTHLAAQRLPRVRALAAVDAARAFRITITFGKNDTFGVTLEETYGDNGHILASLVTRTTAAQTGRITDALLAAVRASGHAPSVLAFKRKIPIRLSEPDGVRLALILLTTQPVSKHARVRALVAGVNAMSIEETYYWYAKCLSADAARARKALRTLLADE